MAKTIEEVMTTDPVMLTSTADVTEAARAMRTSDIGDVIVLDEGDSLCGIVTDRDITVRVVAEGRDPKATKLGDICSRDVETLEPDASIGEAVRLMTERAIRRVPVVQKGRPVGIVSLGDLATTQDPDSGLAEISSAPPNS